MLHAFFSSALNFSGIARGLEEFLNSSACGALKSWTPFFLQNFDEKKEV
jgi:hypothetical protein